MRKVLLATGLVTACAETPDWSSTSQSIVNGQVDTGDPATVYLDLGGGGCTGTLVSAKTVVTAKHCLGSQMWAYFGTYAGNANGTWIQVVHAAGRQGADLAMLTLAEPGPTTPIPLVKANLADHLGDPIRIAGFGVTSENGGGSGTKRMGHSSLDSLSGGIMYATSSPSGTCYGDSGGPSFMMIGGTEYIVGVTSFGTAACGSGLDGSVRIDTYRDWIVGYIEAHDELPPEPTVATCDADGLCATEDDEHGCSAPDPDCPCADDGLCTAACGDLASDADCAGCGAGDECRADCPALDTDCCATDDTCNDACGDADADCAVGGGNGATPDDEEKAGTGGCTTSGGSAGAWFMLGLLALAMQRVRRG